LLRWLVLLILMFILLPPLVVKAQNKTVQILPGTSDITSQTNAAFDGGSTFEPSSLCINKQENVTWNNADNNPHSIVISIGGNKSVLPPIAPGKATSFIFKDAGNYTYYDKYFPYTTGTIKVPCPP
jgi:plastocyanin